MSVHIIGGMDGGVNLSTHYSVYMRLIIMQENYVMYYSIAIYYYSHFISPLGKPILFPLYYIYIVLFIHFLRNDIYSMQKHSNKARVSEYIVSARIYIRIIVCSYLGSKLN